MKARWLILALLAGFAVPFVVPALAADHDVAVLDDRYEPVTTTIAVGDKVKWTDSIGGNSHNVKFEDGGLDHPPSPIPGPWTAERTFTTEGTYRYYCEQHSTGPGVGMSGTVVVGTGGTTSQPTNTSTTPTNTGTTPTNTQTNTTPTDPPPSIASVRPGASTFCTRRSRTCRRPGLRFTVELSEAAELRGVVRRLRRARGAATRRSFTRAGKQGRNVVRVSARGLAPGRYRLTLRAVDAGGNSSPPTTSTFRVRR